MNQSYPSERVKLALDAVEAAINGERSRFRTVQLVRAREILAALYADMTAPAPGRTFAEAYGDGTGGTPPPPTDPYWDESTR